MKRILFFFLPILLTSCSSVGSIFSPIQTIKCKKIGGSGIEFTYTPKVVEKGEPEVVIFNKNTGELFFYDAFFETLIPMSEGDAKWIKSTVINNKLKINQGSSRVFGKAVIDLKNLTGDFLSLYPDESKNVEWDLKCVKVKNLSTKIK